jgi:acyl carrier protein
VTLTPFFVKAVALAIRANPSANSILFQRFPFRRRIARFDVVDVSVPIVRTVHGEQLIFVGTIRGADNLSIAEIQNELTHLQRDPPEQSSYIRKMQKLKRATPILVSLYHWLMARSPRFYLKNAGTCSVTPLDTMAGAHFFPVGPTTAMFGIGGIGDEVVARDGVPVVRRMLHVSLAVDNYIVSGPEAIGLAQTFQQLLETCSFVKTELKRVPPFNVTDQLAREIATRVRLAPEQVEPNAHFLIDLGMSSLDTLAVMAFAEKTFSTRFPDDLLPELMTLNKIVAAVHAHQDAVEEK